MGPFPLWYCRIVLQRTAHRAPCVVCDGVVTRGWLDVEEQPSRSRQLESVETAALPVATTAVKGWWMKEEERRGVGDGNEQPGYAGRYR